MNLRILIGYRVRKFLALHSESRVESTMEEELGVDTQWGEGRSPRLRAVPYFS